jgi:hypothetical protein
MSGLAPRGTALPEPDFSLVLGGPLFQLFRRAYLSGSGLELLRRRVLIISGCAWLPLLVLSGVAGDALGDTVAIPFLYDIEAHSRFLIGLPILIVAELIVHQRIGPVVAQFVERRIVAPEDMPEFHRIMASTQRVRNSVIAEAALVLLVYTLGLWIWRSQVALETASWYATADAEQTRLTPAGYWYFLVSLPIFQFILLRWYLRFGLWFWFLWRVSRLDLRLTPVHPDRAAGLGFLGASANAFAPVLFAQGAVLAGVAASQIFHAGRDLRSFELEIGGFLLVFVVAVLVPLTVFTPLLARARQQGLAAFGGLASRYAREFEGKWMSGGLPGGEPLLGSGDIQSLADLGQSHSIVQEVRLVPFGLRDVARLAAFPAAPLLPLTLTIFSPEELMGHALKILF